MSNVFRIAGAIQDALDSQGIELTWADVIIAAKAVEEKLGSVPEGDEL